MKRLALNASLLVLLTLAACGDEAPKKGNTTKDGLPQPDIAALYDMKCGICHGREGNLMVGGAPDLTKSSLDLAGRIQLITYGKNTMPPQKDLLTPEQIKDLATYVEKFRTN